MVNPKLVAYYRAHHKQAHHTDCEELNIADLVMLYKKYTHQLGLNLRQFEQRFARGEIDDSNYKQYKFSFEKNIVNLLREIIYARLDATIYLRYCDAGHLTYLKLLIQWLNNLEHSHLTSPLLRNTVHEMYMSVVFRIRPHKFSRPQKFSRPISKK